MSAEQAIELILNFVINAREGGAAVVHFDALVTDDDHTTLGDLVDLLPASR